MIPTPITIFTDGSSRGNPGPGGFGAIVITPKNIEFRIQSIEVKELGGREEHTTNNRMELQAAISALSFLSKVKGQRSIVLYTDSSYLVNGITRWVYGWQKNGWKTKEKKDVENRDLWERLVDVTRGKQIEWKQIGGHVGVAGNVRCDDIAQTYAELTQTDAENTLKLYSGSLSDYPIKNILDISHDAGMAKEKISNRAQSNAKAYSYVSLVDGKIETHKTWAECEKQVKGKKARYKKVFSAEEESELIAEWSR